MGAERSADIYRHDAGFVKGSVCCQADWAGAEDFCRKPSSQLVFSIKKLHSCATALCTRGLFASFFAIQT